MIDSSPTPDLYGHLMQIAGDHAMRDELSRMMGDYCHQCRNRLNSLKLSIYLARKQGNGSSLSSWSSIESDYKALEDQVERLQAICRPIPIAPVLIDFALLIDDRSSSWRDALSRHGRGLRVDPPMQRCDVCFDVDRVGTAFDALVHWRASRPPADGSRSETVLLAWGREGDDFVIRWTERLSDDRQSPDAVDAWSLPILSRVVSEHGGSVEIVDQPGWMLIARWPARIGLQDRSLLGRPAGHPIGRP